MIYRGQVAGDMIILADGVRLPDGSEVLVEPVGPAVGGLPLMALPLRNGVPVFANSGTGSTPDLDLVNELRDDAP
jgi:hypothetical protein